jgi:hypothetical protein
MISLTFLAVTITIFSVFWISDIIFQLRLDSYLFLVDKEDAPRLRLNSENEFHISIFSDLHYGEEEHGWGIDQDIKSNRVIRNILHYEDPDLVILSNIFSEFV